MKARELSPGEILRGRNRFYTFTLLNSFSFSLLGGNVQTSGYVPSFNFEDLGLSMKVTPHVHGMDEVSLDVEAEFKVLGSESLNGIPYISNRKLQSKVRIRNGEWAVISGLVDASDTNSVTEVPGLGSIPYLGKALRQNGHDKQSSEVLVLMRPVLLSPPADQFVQRTVWIGSETRLDIPL